MPTKAQLEAQIMQMHSDAAHLQREHDARIEDLEADIEQLAAQVARLRGAIRPFFLPAGSDVRCQEGTAHCPLCNAIAPATVRYAPLAGRHIVATPRPIEHHDGCFLTQEVNHD
jgi:hypothetical protein